MPTSVLNQTTICHCKRYHKRIEGLTHVAQYPYYYLKTSQAGGYGENMCHYFSSGIYKSKPRPL